MTTFPGDFRPVSLNGLPIFRQDRAAYSLFYAPGYLAVTPAASAEVFAAQLGQPEPSTAQAVALRQRAQAALATRASELAAPFRPVSLILYLHNECNLRCRYCYARSSPRPAERLTLPAIAAAAQVVADHCRKRDLPLVAVFHGGGEPSLHLSLVRQALDTLETIVSECHVPLYRYIATNGVMPADRAAWIAQRFDRVGLSCDGPADIQSVQRTLWGGQGTTTFVERTAEIVRRTGASLHVRVTITPETVCCQPEIAEYVCQVLRPEQIHVEAVFRAGRAADGACFAEQQAELFVSCFLEAQAVARRHGIAWSNSGSRLDEIHGPFCSLLRDVIHLTPGDVATACFLAAEASEVRRCHAQIGLFDGCSFEVDETAVQSLRLRVTAQADRCRQCFNQFHCARLCPDAWPSPRPGACRTQAG